MKDTKQEQLKDKFLLYYKTRDRKLRDELINEHMYIVDILSNKYVGRGVEKDDLYQVASLGLIYALDRYNPNKGYKFSSFATPTIMGELKRYFRDKGWVIRVPRRIQDLYKSINSAQKILPQRLQRTPTISDIANYLNVTEEEILETMEASKVYQPESLDREFEMSQSEKPVSLVEIIGMEDKSFESVELNDFIEKSILSLDELEKEILKLRYYDRHTQAYIAKKLNISQMSVSRIEKKIMAKFTKELNKIN